MNGFFLIKSEHTKYVICKRHREHWQERLVQRMEFVLFCA